MSQKDYSQQLGKDRTKIKSGAQNKKKRTRTRQDNFDREDRVPMSLPSVVLPPSDVLAASTRSLVDQLAGQITSGSESSILGTVLRTCLWWNVSDDAFSKHHLTRLKTLRSGRDILTLLNDLKSPDVMKVMSALSALKTKFQSTNNQI